jgi:hypothetical protein
MILQYQFFIHSQFILIILMFHVKEILLKIISNPKDDYTPLLI